MKPSPANLVFRPTLTDSGLTNRVTRDDAGWASLSAETRRLKAGETWSFDTDDSELVCVLFGGVAHFESNRGRWTDVGERENVFSGMPWALYFPRRTTFTVTAVTALDFACAWAQTDEDHEARLVTPADSKVEIRGGGNATRQINSIVPPGFDCHRLVAVEVYTPGGNWSSYPPHKHDNHVVGADGTLLEADLEELYLYKQRRPEGFALQRIYNDSRSLDATVCAQDGDMVLVPEGYHPVSAPWGYDCYYLNFLAGSAQSLACTDDAPHAWVKGTFDTKDARVPMVTHAMGHKGKRL